MLIIRTFQKPPLGHHTSRGFGLTVLSKSDPPCPSKIEVGTAEDVWVDGCHYDYWTEYFLFCSLPRGHSGPHQTEKPETPSSLLPRRSFEITWPYTWTDPPSIIQ